MKPTREERKRHYNREWRRAQIGYKGRPWRQSGIRGLGRDRDRWVITCRDLSRVLYYRAVMEAHLGRHLESHEQVHHINGDPGDDRIENLQLTTRAEHVKIHSPQQFAPQVIAARRSKRKPTR